MTTPVSNEFLSDQDWIVKLNEDMNIDSPPQHEGLGEAHEKGSGQLRPSEAGDRITLNPKPRLEGAFIKYDTVPHCREFTGTFATVKKVFLRANPNIHFAVKIIRPARALVRMRTYEVSIHKVLNHTNICRLEEAFSTNDGSLHLIMEYAEIGVLSERLISKASFSFAAFPLPVEVFAGCIMFQLCTGIEYIHSLGFMHRDVKPDNILISSISPLLLKIADFGLATRDVNSTFICGTRLYMAPETANGECYDNRADLYSVGAVFLDMLLLMHHKPLSDDTSKKKDPEASVTAPAKPEGSANLSPDGKRTKDLDDLQDMQQVDGQALALAKGLLKATPSQRTTIVDALANTWLTEMNARRLTANSGRVLPSTVIVNHDAASKSNSKSDSTGSPVVLPVPSTKSVDPSPSSPSTGTVEQNNTKSGSQVPVIRAQSVVQPPPPQTAEAPKKTVKRKRKKELPEPKLRRRSSRIRILKLERALRRNAPY